MNLFCGSTGSENSRGGIDVSKSTLCSSSWKIYAHLAKLQAILKVTLVNRIFRALVIVYKYDKVYGETIKFRDKEKNKRRLHKDAFYLGQDPSWEDQVPISWLYLP